MFIYCIHKIYHNLFFGNLSAKFKILNGELVEIILIL